MKKILLSMFAVVFAVAAVGSTAYALFSDTVAVEGLTLATGSADLKVNGANNLPAPTLSVTNVYPGWQNGVVFNMSNVSTAPIALDVVAQVTDHSGNWGLLSPVVQVAVVGYASEGDALAAVANQNPGLAAVTNTGWQTLATWDASAQALTSALAQGSTKYFVLWGTVPSSATNDVANKTVTVDFTVTGTQVL